MEVRQELLLNVTAAYNYDESKEKCSWTSVLFAPLLLFLYGSSTLFRTNPQDAWIYGKEYHKGSSVCQYFMSKIEKGYYDPEHN